MACAAGSRTSANDRTISTRAQWTRLRELEIRPADLASQRPGLFEMPLGLVEPPGRELGDAEPEQRHRAQFLAQSHLRRGQGHARFEQPPRLLDRARQVAAPLSQGEPQHAERDLQVPAPIRGH